MLIFFCMQWLLAFVDCNYLYSAAVIVADFFFNIPFSMSLSVINEPVHGWAFVSYYIDTLMTDLLIDAYSNGIIPHMWYSIT